LKAGEPVDEILTRNLPALYRAAAAIMRNKEDAEDIVQETFLKLYEKNPPFASPAHERAWLLRVAINLCRSRLRSPWRRWRVPLLASFPAKNEDERELMQAIFALPAKYRTVIHLFYYEGYATAEIAEITAQKESTVRQQLTRARRLLKVELQEGDAHEPL
jgi:RNA polymerase sigma-70 factor (ECF subfamily)